MITSECTSNSHGTEKNHRAVSDAASAERRIGVSPIPENLDLYLNIEQLEALHTMEYFGWKLAFVRRSDLVNVLPIIQDTRSKEYAVLDDEGGIIRSPAIGIR